MDVAERFAHNLVEQREKKGLPPQSLARLTSIPIPHLRAMEDGAEQPEMETLIRLATSLEVPIGALTDGLDWDPVDGFSVVDPR